MAIRVPNIASQILSNPFTNPSINRDGLSYAVSRMEWYWALVDLLPDEKSSGLRSQPEKHISSISRRSSPTG
ncbi:hypothetical protein LY76DRAFT_119969 [Colletotrichum caudatum]|nr:hypothetical protein LY76DRAFT_119969 [Colletotrichum caudatum]